MSMAGLLEPDVALEQVLAAVPTATSVNVPAGDCLGLVLAADATACADLPPFDRAMMDGYAVRLADAGATVELLGEIAAGDGAYQKPLPAGHAYPIMTGAPLPPGAEAVVPHEQTQRQGDHVDLPERIRPGANIVPRGGECPAGRSWAKAGAVVTPMTLAAALGVGAKHLEVHPRPRVVVIATGRELAADPRIAGQIRDTNGPMLAALFQEVGASVQRQVVGDDAEALCAVLQSLGDVEVVVLTGGVSAGTHDEVPGVLRRLGAEILFHKVAQRPGKPLLVARLGRQLLFGLPGNPLAAHLCACRYVAPALRRLAGRTSVPTRGRGVLQAALPANTERTWFLPALVEQGAVLPLLPLSSADLVQPHQANAYLRLDPGSTAMAAGAEIGYTRIGVDAWAR
jgi:molybdopterin molybdotransferase